MTEHSNDVMYTTKMIMWRRLRDADWKNIKEHGGMYRHYSIDENLERLDPKHWSRTPEAPVDRSGYLPPLDYDI